MHDEPTWRVYLREWLSVFTSDELEVPGQKECQDVFARKYAGRVRREDMRVRGAGPLRPSHQVLELRLPNRRGEFKDRADAMTLASALTAGMPDGAVSTVRSGSEQERELLDYGRKMLPGAG